jgi:glutathione S-transferase
MILIGQYDSGFVRRIGIALTLYDIDYEHRPWSVFGDADKLRELNPLGRVPTLVLEDGEVLVESHAILDFIDGLVPPEKRMFPQSEPHRHKAMKVAALATGLLDRTVSLFYETKLHQETSEKLMARWQAQIAGTLQLLETDRAKRQTHYWIGDKISHADIAVACALRHISESNPEVFAFRNFPALAAHCTMMEALPVFQKISQPFLPPT